MKLLVPNYKIDPMFQHPEYPWYIGSPDALVIADDHKLGDYPIGGVDFKTTSSSYISDWGETGTDEVPPYYHTQAMWYMGLTNAQWWDIAVLFLGSRREFRIYRVMRDDDLIASLIAKGKEFWENHVIPQIPPDVDASPGWGVFFKKQYPVEIDEPIESNDELIAKLKSDKDSLSAWQEVVREDENKIRAIIGNHAGLVSPWGSITWKKNKSCQIIDWESIAKELNPSQDLINKYTTIKEGARVFRTYWKKEQD